MGAKPAPKPQISAGTRAACLPAPRTGPKIRNSREKAQKAQKTIPRVQARCVDTLSSRPS
jgi:hypothetical protein